MSIKNKRLVYNVIIRPTLLYVAPIWGGIISKVWLQKLQIVQSNCMRLVLGARKGEKKSKLHQEAQMQYLESAICSLRNEFFNKIDTESGSSLAPCDPAELPYKIK